MTALQAGCSHPQAGNQLPLLLKSFFGGGGSQGDSELSLIGSHFPFSRPSWLHSSSASEFQSWPVTTHFCILFSARREPSWITLYKKRGHMIEVHTHHVADVYNARECDWDSACTGPRGPCGLGGGQMFHVHADWLCWALPRHLCPEVWGWAVWPGESTGAGKVAGGEGIGPGDTSCQGMGSRSHLWQGLCTAWVGQLTFRVSVTSLVTRAREANWT